MPTLDEIKSKAKKPVVVSDVERTGDKLIIPQRMTLAGAVKLIESRMEYEQQVCTLQEVFEVLPLDGAFAFQRAIERIYGWTPAAPTPGFFGDNPPRMMNVQIGPDQWAKVGWGRFTLPNVTGHIDTGATVQNGMACFVLSAEVKRMDEESVLQLFAVVRAEIEAASIYRGKAIRIRFTDSDGDVQTMPQVTFIDTSGVRESDLIFSADVEQAVRTNLFTPITRAADCLANGIPVKRGILLGGTFGTGKTLAATVASMLAVKHGITFLYVERAAELASAIAFAKRYQSPACAIFCEDIDRAVTGERTVEMDDILNTIDGIDSKDANLIVVLTTNNLDGIHPAMLRPGRLDAVIEVTAPDAHAVQRLLYAYGKGAIDPRANLTEVGNVLAGCIPAVVAEVVKRAKLAQLSLQAEGTKVVNLSPDALLQAALTMSRQMAILKAAERPVAEKRPDLEVALSEVVHRAFNGNAELIQQTKMDTRAIRRSVC